MITSYFIDTIKALVCSENDIVQLKRELFTLAMAVRVADAKPQATTSQAGRYILHGTTGYYNDTNRPFEMYFLDGKLTGSKIAAIKYIRTITGMGLREAKDYVEGLPIVVETRSIDL